ncbi:hypothetical protein BDV37DRAFT_45031 [Aspergillus pseudonomiae]|uniref:Uncharacterized protein n=1 Tax=Aspergillus pseudonomiae TaxID=1506151 RepID=A0A5N7CUR7_9EURO|nr:uncharacterized protein BDV37DRAFT_45031 [Aspergillus pseudonomiae]KAE8397871.1 hypothetical protein BDV37DRAFT_45031 [Aspergillus pseudonomiae]
MAAGAFRGVISFSLSCLFYILDVLCMCWGFWSSTIYVLLLRPCLILIFEYHPEGSSPPTGPLLRNVLDNT